jgi:hypothetical protein
MDVLQTPATTLTKRISLAIAALSCPRSHLENTVRAQLAKILPALLRRGEMFQYFDGEKFLYDLSGRRKVTLFEEQELSLENFEELRGLNVSWEEHKRKLLFSDDVTRAIHDNNDVYAVFRFENENRSVPAWKIVEDAIDERREATIFEVSFDQRAILGVMDDAQEYMNRVCGDVLHPDLLRPMRGIRTPLGYVLPCKRVLPDVPTVKGK